MNGQIISRPHTHTSKQAHTCMHHNAHNRLRTLGKKTPKKISEIHIRMCFSTNKHAQIHTAACILQTLPYQLFDNTHTHSCCLLLFTWFKLWCIHIHFRLWYRQVLSLAVLTHPPPCFHTSPTDDWLLTVKIYHKNPLLFHGLKIDRWREDVGGGDRKCSPQVGSTITMLKK